MEKKRPVGVTIVGSLHIVIALILAFIPVLIYAIFWFVTSSLEYEGSSLLSLFPFNIMTSGKETPSPYGIFWIYVIFGPPAVFLLLVGNGLLKLKKWALVISTICFPFILSLMFIGLLPAVPFILIFTYVFYFLYFTRLKVKEQFK